MKQCPQCTKYWDNDLTRCPVCNETLPSNEASSEDADEGKFKPGGYTEKINPKIRRCGMMRSFPEIDFIMLTKGGFDVYLPYLHSMPENVILGLTVTTRDELLSQSIHVPAIYGPDRTWLLNIEPIKGDFGWHVDGVVVRFDWVIIGAETGNNPDKYVPRFEDFASIYNTCTNRKIPLFCKPSLEGIVPTLTQQFPERKWEESWLSSSN